MRVLVVGAGPAGARCAERTAERLPGAAVTLLSAEAALPYDRVALGRVLAGEADPAALITHDAARLRALGVRFRPATRVAAIDRAARRAVTDRGETIGYDRLVLATGASAVRLPLPGAALPGVFLYRSMADVLSIGRAAVALDRGPAVVIGGGLLGLEAAACLALRGQRITVVHAVDWPMERQLDPEAGALLARRLGATRGIRFAMPARTEAIEGDAAVTGVRLEGGRVLPARLVVLAVGVRPDTRLAATAGLTVGRGIRVDDALRTDDPALQAIGDCVEHRGVVSGLVAPALAQAEAAAAVLAGDAAAYAPRADAAALKVSGTAVWSAGDIAAPDAESIVLHDGAGERYRRLLLRDGRLVGAVLYGDTADSGFYLGLIASGRTVPRAGRASLAVGPEFLEAA